MNEQKLDEKIESILTALPKQKAPNGFAERVMKNIATDSEDKIAGEEKNDWLGDIIVALAVILIFLDSLTISWLGNIPAQKKSRKIMISEFSKVYLNAEPQMFQADEKQTGE